jgi:solute carrier family 45 protein 1/2/4
MTYCTPYLLRLGLTKDKVSLVWLAGPLSGLIMQPIVGILADKTTSPWGRRRPFMFIGTLIVCFSLFILGWTSEVVSLFVQEEDAKKSATVVLAVLAIYGIDFAINAVQASTRSLISDTLPLAKQQTGSAWASRMVAIGSLVGYGFGAMDLTKIFGNSIGNTQFKQLIVVAGCILVITVGATCWAVSEKVLVVDSKEDDPETNGFDGVMTLFKQIWTTALNLPDRIAAICWVQFWCWIGWFPFLFYSTTWLGEVYLRFNAPAEAKEHSDSLGQIGRVGSTALIVFSVVTFASSVVMPWFIDSPAEEANGFTPRPPESIAWIVAEIEKHKPNLVAAWSYSHIIFAGSMFAAPFVTSLRAATAIVALCGM